MKTWTNFFDQINEDHVESKDRVKWICDKVKGLNEKEVEKLYHFMEKEFKLEGK
jgi:hypothetical protein